MANEKFKVIYKGKLKEGFEINQVAVKFAFRYKLTPEKALKILQARSERVLIKQIDHVKAYKLKSDCEAIGMQVRLERVTLVTVPVETSKAEPIKENNSNIEKDYSDSDTESDSWKIAPINNKIENNTQGTAPHYSTHVQSFTQKPDYGTRPISGRKVKTAYDNDSPMDIMQKPTNKIILLLTALILIWFWNKEPTQKGVFDVNGNPDVIVFTVEHCLNICNDVISELNKRGVPFRELIIDPSDETNENVVLWKDMGSGGFPIILSGMEKVIGNSKAQLATLLGNNFDMQYLTSVETKYYDSHFYSDGSPKIVLYGTDWCGYCAKLRKDFKNQNVDYVDIDVDKSRNKTELIKTLEINGYPAVWIGYKRVRVSNFEGVQAELNKI